jgi:hypothetical protein
MNIPGFVAEASLDDSNGRYRGHEPVSPADRDFAVVAALSNAECVALCGGGLALGIGGLVSTTGPLGVLTGVAGSLLGWALCVNACPLDPPPDPGPSRGTIRSDCCGRDPVRGNLRRCCGECVNGRCVGGPCISLSQQCP